MLALSIRQPHIHHILYGDKVIEYRAWRAAPKFRGFIALHAGLTVDWDCVDDEDFVPDVGGILGVARIHEAYLNGTKDVHIWLKDRKPLIKPIRYTGKLGFFPVVGEALTELQRQLKLMRVKP